MLNGVCVCVELCSKGYCDNSTQAHLISCVTCSVTSRHRRLCVPVFLKDFPRVRAPCAYWSLVASVTNASVLAGVLGTGELNTVLANDIVSLATFIRHDCRWSLQWWEPSEKMQQLPSSRGYSYHGSDQLRSNLQC